MRQIEVVAAIIQRDGAYFATQRGYGTFTVEQGCCKQKTGNVLAGYISADLKVATLELSCGLYRRFCWPC